MKKSICAFVLAAALMGTSVSVFAESTQDRLNAAKEQQYETAVQLQSTQDRIAVLETKKGETEDYLKELNSQLGELSGQIKDLQKQYADKQKELDQISVELGKARIEEEKQRESMKLRIQYMYERSENSGILEALFSAESFSDLVNRADNIANISAYDRKMLDEYSAICATIEETEAKVQSEQQEISELEKTADKKKAEMQELADQTADQVAAYAVNIKDEESTEMQLVYAIQEQEASIRALTAEVEEEIRQAEAAAEAERQRQAAEAAAQAEAEAAAQAAAEAEEADYYAETEEDPEVYDDYAEEEVYEEDTEDLGEAETPASSSVEDTDTKETASSASNYDYSGEVLNRRAGTVTGPSGKETYYNLNMSGVVNIMRNMGNADKYWVRDDGVKMLGDYVMVAANLDTHPRGSIVDSSLGKAIVCDTGTFAYSNPNQLDVAVDW